MDVSDPSAIYRGFLHALCVLVGTRRFTFVAWGPRFHAAFHAAIDAGKVACCEKDESFVAVLDSIDPSMGLKDDTNDVALEGVHALILDLYGPEMNQAQFMLDRADAARELERDHQLHRDAYRLMARRFMETYNQF